MEPSCDLAERARSYAEFTHQARRSAPVNCVEWTRRSRGLAAGVTPPPGLRSPTRGQSVARTPLRYLDFFFLVGADHLDTAFAKHMRDVEHSRVRDLYGNSKPALASCHLDAPKIGLGNKNQRNKFYFHRGPRLFSAHNQKNVFGMKPGTTRA